MLLISTNPTNDDVLWIGNETPKAEVLNSVKKAKKAFKIWSKTTLEYRISLLKRYTELLTIEKDYLTKLITAETGKPLWEAATEVEALIGKFKNSVDAYNNRCASDDTRMFKALGVMAVIGPFNFPMHLPNGHIVPALLAGNTIVFKPSELTPLCGDRLVSLLHSAGIPFGVVNLVQGGKTVGNTLVKSKINAVLFTGSYNVGKLIHKQLAGRPDVLLALEMGGNNPLVCWNPQDKLAAIHSIIMSAFITAGQRCVCARRLIVQDNDDTDELITLLVKNVENLKVGLPTETIQPFMGTMISKEACSNVMSSFDNMKHSGGMVLLKPKIHGIVKSIMSPGIIDMTNAKRTDDEVFGPLLQIIRVKTFEDAIDEANNTSFGLSAGLISDDPNQFHQFKRDIRAGIINYNTQTTGASGSNPFGGVGHSGNYRPGGSFAADYCAYPVSTVTKTNVLPTIIMPGINLIKE